jgi:acetoin utilization deacetylase AcuC-like enzyme
VHTEEYLQKLANGRLSHEESFRLGFTVTPELFERCRLEVAGTIAAAEAALKDGIAVNLAGGTHHAFADRGRGFCLLNDVAITLRRLQQRDPGLGVLVIDTDAHQGDGTNFLLRSDSKVFTYDIHVGKNYPTSKEPASLDVALGRWVNGEDYLQALRATLPKVLEEFDPDFLFWIAGADPHWDDRFGQMQLSDEHLASRDHFILGCQNALEIPMAVLYGGGYNRQPGKTGQLHAATVTRVLSSLTNEAWAKRF